MIRKDEAKLQLGRLFVQMVGRDYISQNKEELYTLETVEENQLIVKFGIYEKHPEKEEYIEYGRNILCACIDMESEHMRIYYEDHTYMSKNKEKLFSELKTVLDNLYPKVEENVYQLEDGLMRISVDKIFDRIHVIVEWADNGIEADNRLFDDAGLYPVDEASIEEILKDMEIAI